MKKIIFSLLAVTLFTACKNDTGAPSSAIDGMFTAMKSGNMDEMKKFISKSDISILEAGEKIMNNIDPEAINKIKGDISKEFKEKVKDVSYSLKNEKIEGDKATVDAEVTEGEKKSTHTFDLVKEDGAWKISLFKSNNGMFNSMKGNMGPDKQDIEAGIEKLKSMPPDSLKAMLNKVSEVMDSIKSKKNKE